MIIGKDKIFEIWKQINSYEEKYCGINVTKFPRLELLLSSIAYVEKYCMGMDSLKDKFLDGLKAFDEVPFNDNHILLAALLHAGAHIMTANFDLGIERAYRELYEEDCNNVIHFHGTNLSGDKIGATIENITRFVNKTIDKKVKSSFYNERTNYFFGYSFSDMYDINAAIYELYSDADINYTKDNWVCNHNGLDCKLKNKVFDTFRGKDNVHIFDGDTTEVLKELCKKYSVVIPRQSLKNKTEPINDNQWTELFLKKIEITEEFKILSTIHFLNRMGIAVDQVDINILKKYEKMKFENTKKEIFEYHLAANSKYWYECYADSRLKTDYHKKELRQRIASSKLARNLQKNYSLQSVSKVLQSLWEKNFIGYEDFSELTKRIHEIKFNLLISEEPINDKDARYLIEEFSKYPVGKFIGINLYASIYRYKTFLDGIAGEKNWKTFQKASEIYYDIGNVDGIVSTQIDFLTSHNYKRSADDWKLIFQSQQWIELKSICKVTGSYRYEQLMKNYETIKTFHKKDIKKE